VGALGQHHARIYASLPTADLVGVQDIDAERGASVARRHDCRLFADLEQMLPEVEAVSVAVPTLDHHGVARALLDASKHVLVEKPMTTSLDQADDLITRAESSGLVLQVGHVERFNPAVDVLRATATRPHFIEVHRLAPFSPRSLDIDVVLDLMIHDLDILLALDGSEAVQVDAVGVPVLSAKFDIANARLRFRSGLIANLTASRISLEKLRKFRVWSHRTYVSADFVARRAQVCRLVDGEKGLEIALERGAPTEEEPLRRQLASFLGAVRGGRPPEVSGSDGRRALALAHTILSRMAGDSNALGLPDVSH